MPSNQKGVRRRNGKPVAFLDVGTNSVRLLVVRRKRAGSVQVLAADKVVVRLGDGEFLQKHLFPEAIRRTVSACVKFVERARALGAGEIVAAATSATREAANRAEFVKKFKAETGVSLRVLSGEEEALLIYRGVVSGISLGDRQALFVDIGGGSTEITVGAQHKPRCLESLPLGAIRLTNRFFESGYKWPISQAKYGALCRYARDVAADAIRRLMRHRLDLAIGSSGTIMNLGDIAARRFLGRRLQRNDVLRWEHLREVIRTLCALPLAERRRVPGLNPDRADIVVSGAAILDMLMSELGFQEICVSDRSLRDGLVVDHFFPSGRALVTMI